MRIFFVWIALFGMANGQENRPSAEGTPLAADARLVVERFAGAPDIVQPIATDFDSRGRLLVVESHTHFRPAKYSGPEYDRVRILEDTNGDGKADRFTTFFEGTTATMDLAVHVDGSVYVATRNEIIRLRDKDNDGKADEKTRIVFLDTAGNYPHNGLSGLTFDAHGDLYFGMGENLGASYKLAGADGQVFAGGGEGGNFFWCTADGKKLRRVATGFWNPFGACRDLFGRLWVVDNDPDSSPPCRLLNIVEGGDYGYQFRYGRSGRHPFQAWNGELPGTLPMAAGTGESPCEVVSYESDGLPEEYRGQLLVPAWADHRVERYVPGTNGAGVAAVRKPFIQGGKDFYPSGLTIAPDGSLFVTDWGSRSYELHGKGAVWHIRWKDAENVSRAADPKQAMLSPHRPARDAAARTLARDDAGRAFLRDQLKSKDVYVRAAALDALIAAGDSATPLGDIARSDAQPELRAMAVRALAQRGVDTSLYFASTEASAIRVEAIRGLPDPQLERSPFTDLLASPDPFLRQAVIHRLARLPELATRYESRMPTDPKARVGFLLALRESRQEDATRLLPGFLKDPDPEVRLLALKWVADEQRTAFRPQLTEAMKDATLDARGYLALATALARLDDRPVSEDALASYFLGRLRDRTATAATRRIALRAIPATHAGLSIEKLIDLLKDSDPTIRVESLRLLNERADARAAAAIRTLAGDSRQPAAVRAQGVVALASQADADFLIQLAKDPEPAVRMEAVRALVPDRLTAQQRKTVSELMKSHEDLAILGARALGQPFHGKRPAATDTEGWLKHLEGPGDPESGRRVFEHSRLAGCAKCHRADGRGADFGPDLSLVGRTDRRWIVESLLQPGAVVAPHFQVWRIDTLDGRTRTGQLVRTYLDESYYVDAKGERFKVMATDVAEINAATGSIMPDKLVDLFTDQELRDLIAYLASRK